MGDKARQFDFSFSKTLWNLGAILNTIVLASRLKYTCAIREKSSLSVHFLSPLVSHSLPPEMQSEHSRLRAEARLHPGHVLKFIAGPRGDTHTTIRSRVSHLQPTQSFLVPLECQRKPGTQSEHTQLLSKRKSSLERVGAARGGLRHLQKFSGVKTVLLRVEVLRIIRGYRQHIQYCGKCTPGQLWASD